MKGTIEVVSENDVMGRFVQNGNINNINKIFGRSSIKDNLEATKTHG